MHAFSLSRSRQAAGDSSLPEGAFYETPAQRERRDPNGVHS